jgi:quercetin dioxygenase-like cupin family protein
MYSKNFYKGKSEQEIIQDIEREGFDPIPITNVPGYVYPLHKHPETKILVFLKGGMRVTTLNKTFDCKPGDKLIIPGNTPHKAIVENEGCTFFWSEKIL